MIISVFGGSFGASEEDIQLAYELGKRIGLKGHTLKNGGYNGTMEASAKGCREQGGKVIGICVEDDPWATPNRYSTHVIHMPFEERVRELMKYDRAIILPGQVGTLEELFMAWTNAIVDKKDPIYFVGDKSIKLVDFLIKEGWVRKDQEPTLKTVKNLDEIDFLKL
ncbi:MAG TPA: LOG family protein [Candidatus Nanoarchaeia archaeon]|nr:LOG family protein [Candidatus Nanoarchaeia archaeon]